MSADLNANVCCASRIATIEATGPDDVAVVLQGKLEGDVLMEAGILVQPWSPKVVQTAEAVVAE